MKKILVTGATGFIGNYVIQELLKNKYSVIATSLNQAKATGLSWFNEVPYIPFNIREIDDSINYLEYFGKPDSVIHLAWEGLPNYNDEFHIKENLPAHVALLSNLIKNGLNDLTVTGTCFEYGMQSGRLSEDMDVYPANPYAIAKNELRLKLDSLAEQNNIDLKWIRLFYMYGKGQNPRSLLAQLETALDNNEKVFNMSGGEQIRDFLPIEKVAEYIVKIAVQVNVKGIINCSSDKPITVKNLVTEYLKKLDKYIELNLGFYPYPNYEPMAFWGNNEKLRSIR